MAGTCRINRGLYGRVELAGWTARLLVFAFVGLQGTGCGRRPDSGESETAVPRSVEEQRKRPDLRKGDQPIKLSEPPRLARASEPPAPARTSDGKTTGADNAADEGKQAATEVASSESSGVDPALLDPAQATGQAPDEYAVKFETTKGDFIVDVKRAWAPLGADRFYNLVRIGYFSDVAFFRVVEGFMAQVGIHGQPEVNAAWRRQSIKDDPVTQSNKRGYVTFATSGKDSRVNQFFINFVDNSRLDPMGFAPFGKVRDMSAVDKLHAGYGESAPAGRGPQQGRIVSQGNVYLRAQFPELDYIKSAKLLP